VTRQTVAYLGPSGTFTHQAVVALCPDAEALPVGSQAEALAAIESGTAGFAVLPIDNSVNGVVVPTLDGLLERPGLSIVDSAVVPISFDAFTRDPAVEPRVVVSHPHALAQCRAWIERRGLTSRESLSTAAACRDLQPGEIGIGPAICGSLYSLDVVDTAVEDNTAAFTQFALVAAGTDSPGSQGPQTSATGSPDDSDGGDGLLVVIVPDENVPGILRRLLGVLEDRGINMTNLVTRPVPETPGLFVFLLFLSGAFSAEDFAAMRDEWSALGATARAVGRISPLADLAARA
jgi:prephenate dehydratase